MKQKVVTAVSVAALAGISVIGIGFFAEPFAQTEKTAQAAASLSTDVVKETVVVTEVSTENAPEEPEGISLEQTTEPVGRELKKPVSSSRVSKEDIFYMMLNSIDYYDKISGTIYVHYGNIDFYETVTFQCALSDTAAYAHEMQYACNQPAAISAAECAEQVKSAKAAVLRDVETSCTGEQLYYVDHSRSAYRQEQSYNITTLEQAGAIPDEERHFTMDDGFPAYSYRANPTNIPSASICIFPQEMTFGYLTDTDLWEIKGVEKLNGRTCYHITGVTEESYGKKLGVASFEFYVDTNTGVLLKYVGYDTNGNISDYLYSENMQFEEKADAVKAASIPRSNQNEG